MSTEQIDPPVTITGTIYRIESNDGAQWHPTPRQGFNLASQLSEAQRLADKHSRAYRVVKIETHSWVVKTCQPQQNQQPEQ